MKVLCGTPCAKFPVFDEFYDAWAALDAPEGSLKLRAKGGSVPRNLNTLVTTMLEQDCSHLFIVEDDSTFAPDTVMRLLAHDKPVVTGLCRSRTPPFRPYIYESLDPVTGLAWRELKTTDKGLIKVAATGMGGILIRRDVIEKLTPPWFQHIYVGMTEWGQDVFFGKSLVEAGIDVYCDVDVTIWHATQCVLGSRYINGRWATIVKIADAEVVLFVDQ